MPALAGAENMPACTCTQRAGGQRTETSSPQRSNDKRRQSYIVLLFRPQDCIYPSYVDARPRGGMFENSCTAVAGVVWNKLSSTPELRRARIFFVDPATTCACMHGSHRAKPCTAAVPSLDACGVCSVGHIEGRSEGRGGTIVTHSNSWRYPLWRENQPTTAAVDPRMIQ